MSRRASSAGKAISTAAEAAERDELPPLLDYLEGVIPDSGYLVGDRLTLADIAVAGPFANLAIAASRSTEARYPKVTAYVGAILARPSFASLYRARSRLSGNGAA